MVDTRYRISGETGIIQSVSQRVAKAPRKTGMPLPGQGATKPPVAQFAVKVSAVQAVG